jgi:cytochrome P450|tara:strand:- start:918 stop:2174 length:1257 start_codon:yes stop_codon:yes gene_type:complete
MEDYEDIMDPAVQGCPYGLYSRLRNEAPIYKIPDQDFYLVTSFDLCLEIMRQPELFASGVSPMSIKPGGVPDQVIQIYEQQGWLPTASCSTSDRPRHQWVRDLLKKLFTTARVRKMGPFIAATTQSLIDDFSEAGECEFIDAFAHPLPMIVIADQLGIPTDTITEFKRWSDAIVEPFSMMVTPEREIECAKLVVEMQHFFKREIDRKRGQGGSDLITICADALDHEGNPVAIDELLSIVTIDLLASGNETTTAAIASGMLKLVEQPALVSTLRADPRLIPAFAEEILRLEAPAQGMFRRVTNKTRLAGIDFDVGDILSLRFGAANRDDQVFPNADQIDLSRQALTQHLTFGRGRHFCIGASLAREELVISFRQLIETLDKFRLSDPDYKPHYMPSFFGRHLHALPIAFEPNRAGSIIP